MPEQARDWNDRVITLAHSAKVHSLASSLPAATALKIAFLCHFSGRTAQA